MPTQDEKVNDQTTEVISYLSPQSGKWETVTKEVPSAVARAARLLVHRGEHGVHLAALGGSANAGRDMLAELDLLGFLFRVTAMPRRGTGNAEVWVIGSFRLVEPEATAAA